MLRKSYSAWSPRVFPSFEGVPAQRRIFGRFLISRGLKEVVSHDEDRASTTVFYKFITILNVVKLWS